MADFKKMHRRRLQKRKRTAKDLSTVGKLLTGLREQYTSEQMYEEVLRLKQLAESAQADGESALAKAFLFGAKCGTIVHVRMYVEREPPPAASAVA